MEVADIQ